MKAILIAVDGETTVVAQDGLGDLHHLVDGDIELVAVGTGPAKRSAG